MLEFEQSGRDFRFDGQLVYVRVIEPSGPRGVWPGNSHQIRFWSICRPGTGVLTPCTDEEVIQFEKELGEVSDVCFAHHSTLGRVAVGKPLPTAEDKLAKCLGALKRAISALNSVECFTTPDGVKSYDLLADLDAVVAGFGGGK